MVETVPLWWCSDIGGTQLIMSDVFSTLTDFVILGWITDLGRI